MKDKIAVKRYGDAFIGFAKETIGVEKAVSDLKSLKNVVITNNPGFLEILYSPEINFSEKFEFIDAVLNNDYAEETKYFLRLLIDKGRIDQLIDIIEYIRVTYSHGEEVEALLKTSFPLDLDLIKAIESRLEHKFSRHFKFYIDLDASLLGGIQVTIGNTVIDGSVRRRLDELREKLMKVRV